MDSADQRGSCASLIEFLELELLLVLGMRNLDTVNNDGRVLREEGVDGTGEILLVVAVDDRGDVVLGPLSEVERTMTVDMVVRLGTRL